MNINVVEADLRPTAEVHAAVSQLTKQIRNCCQTVRSGPLSFPELHENILALEKLVFAEEANSSAANLTLSQITADERADLNRAYCLWETELENQYAREILSGRETTLDNYLLNERFERLITRELSLL